MNILEKANDIIHGDRNQDYGHPADNHGLTADFWDRYVREVFRQGRSLNARDVCWMNILQKCSRDLHLPKEDNEVDTAGYAGNMEMIREKIINQERTTVDETQNTTPETPETTAPAAEEPKAE